jgi:hypothetical protein
MIARQGGTCALCPEEPTCIDHDHDTGIVRGILCRQCNGALGKLGDSVESLMRAVEYVRHGGKRA